MLKLPKGLKKKKNKKSKKNQELFTEEELEQFKREQRAKQLAEQEQAEPQEQVDREEEEQEQRQQQHYQQQHQYHQQEPSASTSKPKTDEDEWSKFTQLTSGIDSILKKTQGDLNRIKEQSFFQKVEPPKPPVKPEPEEVVEEKEPEPELTEEELEEQRKLAALKEVVVELSESEGESEDADDIFDTNYIDELASGNLVYVPESPEEEDLGPDPFDTNFADKVIKGPEVSKRGKKIVHIGAAVEVLTGRVDNVALKKDALKRPRRGLQNLLLSSFEQDKESTEEDIVGVVDIVAKEEPVEAQPVLSLLDDASDIVADVPIDLSTSLHLDFYKKKQEEEREAERLRKELERDEFDELAEESLTKKADVIVVDPSAIVTEPAPIEPGNWKSEFEEQAELGIVDIYDDELEEQVDVDPFDTEFVATVVREKSIDDDDFDPRADEEPVKRDSIVQIPPTQPTLAVQQKDLLSGSTSDLTDLKHVPVIQASESIEKEIDPFDTSAISALVQPKETEIKFLEKELLSDVGLKHSISDPDFDPRSDEPQQKQPQAILSTAERKSSLSLNIVQSGSKSVGFDVSGGLAVNNNGDHKKKPVTPYYSDKTIKDESDISDSEFDPRATTPHAQRTQSQDLLSVGEENIDSKVLTPATTATTGEENDEITAAEDPFDTSNASALLLPGKAELKLIENELIETVQSTEVTNVLDINSDSQELGLGGKVLTPQITLPVEESFDDIDPFDTTFASNIAPGQAEIKILESELIHK